MTIDPTSHRIPLAPPQSVVDTSAEVFAAGPPDGHVIVLAHGAGSRLDHHVHRGVAAAVAATGHVVVTFNFGYAEAGRRSPDATGRLLTAYRDVLGWVRDAYPGRPLVAGGRSMGGRMASLLSAQGEPLAGLALLNYPLVASAGRGGPRVDHWPDLAVPVLFVHGSRDRLFPDDVFAAHRARLTVPVAVHVVDDADHVFAVPRRAGRTPAEVYAEVAGAVDRWLADAVVAA
ncbi:MAG TPA: alpha/beta fold hydrolase [Acidimicrobiales bacterium]|nr:alpha/beta fold hydrolase [Acidimicrobiales bacterium]